MHQRARDRDPLQLAAGQLSRGAVTQPFEADGRQDAVDAIAARTPQQLERQPHVVGDAQVRQHMEGLEHEAQVFAAQAGGLGLAESQHLAAGQGDAAGVGGVEAGHAVEQRRLADARLAEQRDELAARHHERDVAEDEDVAVALGQAVDGEERGRIGAREVVHSGSSIRDAVLLDSTSGRTSARAADLPDTSIHHLRDFGTLETARIAASAAQSATLLLMGRPRWPIQSEFRDARGDADWSLLLVEPGTGIARERVDAD